MGRKPRESLGMACSACYYLVISSTHLTNGHFRRVKGVFRGPLCPSANDSPERTERALGCSVEDLKALFYCELCQKQYLRHQEFDNHINSYDHAHKQRLKELKHREFARNVASKSWKDQRKQEKALRRLHQLAQLQQDTQRVPGRTYGLRSAIRAVRQQQDKDTHQRNHNPEETPETLKQIQKPSPTQVTTAPLSQLPEDPYQSPSHIPLATALAESPVVTHLASNTGTPAKKSCLGLYPQLPLPEQGRVGGRLGVSFCFSRRGPRLEPSASVFSDLEEEEREKREQMKERIKGIMEDIYREAEGRKHSDSEKFQSCSEDNGLSHTVSIPREATREEEEMVKESSPISTAAPDNLSPSSLLRPSQTLVTIWDRAPARAHMDIGNSDSETEKKQESEAEREGSQHRCVRGKDGSTCLRWPLNLLKFTKSQPRICYSCNPLCLNHQQTEKLTEDGQASQYNLLSALSGESNPDVPTIITPHTHTCLQRQTRKKMKVHRKEKVEEKFKARQHNNVESGERLFLENKNLLPLETQPERERCTLSMENCVRAASNPFDPVHSDNSKTNSQNPLGGRLGGATGIRERAITALSCKSESVNHTGTQEMCISLSRCECGSETECQCASTPQPYVGVSEMSCKKRRASTKKHKLRKKKGEKEKASNKHQPTRCKVRSIVSTVFTGSERRGQAGGGCGRKRRQEETGKTRMRREVRSARSGYLLGRCKAEPVSISVSKRRPNRGHSTESQSEAEDCSSQFTRHTADRDTMREGRPNRDAVTFPWRSHFSLHSFSSGCNSKLFWERGHHSNPRSFIDCCYPDNSCGSSPPRKRKLLHRDRIFIHHKRKSLRHCEVWEETERVRKKRGPSGCRDRGLISHTEQREWMRGSNPGGWRSRNKAVESDRLAKFSPRPSSWSRRTKHLNRGDVECDRCSMDRWTLGSSDSCEDRGTYRSISGSRTGADHRDSPEPSWKCAGTRHSNLKHFSSPEWWTSRQTCSPQSMINVRSSRCHSPRSCSPCSSTGMSELSWEWSRSSTSSAVEVDGSTVSSGRTSSGAQGLSSVGPQEAKKQRSPTPSGFNSSSVSHSSPDRSSLAPAVLGLNLHHCGDTNPSRVKGAKSQSYLGNETSSPVTTSRSDATPGLSLFNSGQQKSARMLLLPLIGKLPSIQKKARSEKGLLKKCQEKEGEDEDEAKGNGAVTSQKCPLDMTESNASSTPNLCLSQIRTNDIVGETAQPISFTAAEMDKYRILQEQAREHMQKILEKTQENADTHIETNHTHKAQTDNCGTPKEHYTPVPLPNPSQSQTQSVHTDTTQTQAQHTLHVSLPLPHVTSPENFTQPIALGVPSLPPLQPSSPLSSLHHIILQQTALPMPPSSSPSSSPSPSPTIHPHQAHLLHPLPPLHPSHLHLPPFSLSSLFPSILLSHHPIPLLPQSPTFHATPLGPLSSVTLQPLNPQTFMDRAWPVRFQQKAL